MIPTLLAISFISFIIIVLPPGDFATAYVAELESMGQMVDPNMIEDLREYYGLDKPWHVHYFTWLRNIVFHGDLGRSLVFNKPVSRIILEKLPWSMLISLGSFIFVYIVAIPIGTFSATHQYSIRDYIFTFIGFIGLAIPNFLFALILMWVYFVYTGNVSVGLFSTEFMMVPWSLARLWDLIKHLWMPAVVIGTAGTCGLIRLMRANLLDELQKPYVMVAKSKGLSKNRVLYKYPFRVAINPAISTIGWMLPGLVSGELLVSLVLGIPTLAPMFLDGLKNQDMYLAGSIVLVLSTLTVIGTLISDILLAWVDPRIRESV
jgi:peptide/nickel transport system permease protein